MGNNNAYINIKISQIDAEKKRLGAAAKKAKSPEKEQIVATIKRLNDRRAGYVEQIVDEKKSTPAPQADED